MIREYRKNDLPAIMQIWLETNIQTHDFISEEYWTGNCELVKELMPQAEVYVYEEDSSGRIAGFIGLTEEYIEGIFVKGASQSKGIGKQLLDHAKNMKKKLTLSVYQKNQGAIHFYQREHFEIYSENMDENTGEKEFFMVWNPDRHR